ncbi:CAMK/CAMKL/CHK1 protein kinase [Macrolepiota fuliginosa MF-IS2]|uniref:CAMK/CAMKL/CHK1 protein kinase n=1 Tax=Macrolepiota fuliginosa MF-IS2 TaxID=1400762 RepID=A0A9P5XAS4_9AGAR|nr:CAMK/CAMKL/CHK1 protein kinase [Macrolepiota fuliginosa MF-IS2]
MSAVKYPKIIGYELVEQIGGGGFSSVFRAANLEEHRVAACKVIALTPGTTDKQRKSVDKEMRVHSALKHRNVLEFLNAVVVELKHAHLYFPGIYMLMELAAGGDLFDKIAPDVGVGDEVAHFYFGQLLAGMEYIHKQGVCHRDLKPENILLDAAGTLKISDFGLAAVYKLVETGKTRTLTERCGSLPYVAPELNSDNPYQAEPIDVWGIGVILFTLLLGNTPWDEPTIHSPEFCKYASGSIFSEQPWFRLSTSALSLIRGMLTIDPNKRMTLNSIQADPWVMRPSQLASQSVVTLADKLTESLRKAGDLELANPNIQRDVDGDGDEIMASEGYRSQFTQSLLLFSQTQSGSRYTPHLTRFYASLGPSLLFNIIHETLVSLNVQCKVAPVRDNEPHKLRIGGHDKRRMAFKGWVYVEKFVYRDRNIEGSFVLMTRDEGNPISWRQLWKALIESEAVSPHVLRK